ncbi:MAG TPA: site-specific integrase [Clostridiales bacterium]|nr:MAG: hypothetical protein A2Y22_08560 [Clostridiales bacterium GWD2_32_59]HAN09386.1 site-specific integrase [Clostridiales bacterium]
MTGTVRKRGSSWSYVFDIGKVNGNRKKVEKGGFKTKKDAQVALRTAIDEFESGGEVFNPEEISVSDYFDYWMENYVKSNLKFTTYEHYERDIRNHIRPALGNYYLNRLSIQRLQDFFTTKSREGYSANSLKGFYGILSGAFEGAIKWGYLKSNPIQRIIIPSGDDGPKDVAVLTPQEIGIILKKLNKKTSFYIPLVIALNTGMRAAEVTGLTWDNVNFTNNTIQVTKILQRKDGEWIFTTPKTKTSTRNMVMPNNLRLDLLEWKEQQRQNKQRYENHYHEGNNICTKETGELITTDSFKYLSRVINRQLKIRFYFHMLRHTHATMLLGQGIHPKIVQERLGHKKITTTLDTYSHVSMNMQTEAISAFDSYLTSALPPT